MKKMVINVHKKRVISLLFTISVCFISHSVFAEDVFNLLYNANAGSGHQDRPLNLANRTGSIVIDTDSMTIYGDITPTRYGEDVYGVCVFRFSYVNIGPNVNVTIQGKRPLAILSATDMVINTNLTVQPGTLGGAFGGEGGKTDPGCKGEGEGLCL